jgi:hypothetical protein
MKSPTSSVRHCSPLQFQVTPGPLLRAALVVLAWIAIEGIIPSGWAQAVNRITQAAVGKLQQKCGLSAIESGAGSIDGGSGAITATGAGF